MTRPARGPRFTFAKFVGLVVATIAVPAIIVGLFVLQAQDDRAQAHGIRGEYTVRHCVWDGISRRSPLYDCTGNFRADHQGFELTAISMQTQERHRAGSRVPAYVTGPHASSAGEQFNPATEKTTNINLSVAMVVFLVAGWLLFIRELRRRRVTAGSVALDIGSPLPGR